MIKRGIYDHEIDDYRYWFLGFPVPAWLCRIFKAVQPHVQTAGLVLLLMSTGLELR